MLLLPFRLVRWLLGSAGAWLFALGSTAGLIWLLREYNPDPTAVNSLVSVSTGGEMIYPIGLAYSGKFGFLLGAAEATTLVMAIVLSFFRANAPRRVGLTILLAWSVLCTASLLMLAASNPFQAGVQAGVCMLFCAATALRTTHAWSRRPRLRRCRRIRRDQPALATAAAAT
ncbi:MAG: hypothetical protein KAS72_06315 [Phycisphaerales bacterium]|nr:hypothetical protein [Phycisphaerales bacterium]